MRHLLVLLFILGGPAVAESIADSAGGGGMTGSGNFNFYKRNVRPQVNTTTPVVQIKGRFTQFDRNKFCNGTVQNQIGSSFFVMSIEPDGKSTMDLPLDERVVVGEAILNEDLPLRRGDIEPASQRYSPPAHKSKTTYDGSTLRITRHIEINGQPTIGLFEIDVDPNLQQIGRVRYREFIGEELSTAKPTENEMICEDLMG